MELDTPLRDIAVEHPLSTRVFQRYQIDFYCAGARPLREACRARDLDPQEVFQAIRRELSSPEPELRWDQAPLEDLIDYLVAHFHEPLREELPRLQVLAHRAARTQGPSDPERLIRIAETVDTLAEDLLAHMDKEEQVLFPLIRGGSLELAHTPISVMEEEHLVAAERVRSLRELTHGSLIPRPAGASWRALWDGLERLEVELHEHIHLENNVLHRRARAQAG